MTRRTGVGARDGQHRSAPRPPAGVWVRHKGKRVFRSPYGYMLSASCRGRLWVNWTDDPDATGDLVRSWCPFPVTIDRIPMPQEKVTALLNAISPWRVRRGSFWHRTPPEMKDALDRLAAA